MTDPKPPVSIDEALRRHFATDLLASQYSPVVSAAVHGYHARDAEIQLAQYSAHQRGETVAAQEKRIAELEAEVAALRRQRADDDYARGYNARDAEVERQVDALEAEVARLNGTIAGLRDQIDRGGCAASHAGELTYECNAERPCGLCRLRGRAESAEAEVAELRKRESELEAELDECESEAGEAVDSAPRRTPELTERVRAVVRSWLVPSGVRDFGPEMAIAPLTDDVLDEIFGKGRTDG